MQEQKWDSLKADTSASHSGKNTRRLLIAELIKTSVLVLSAFAAIVLGTIAWFSSNTKVASGGIEISHQYDTIRLATKGERQTAEINLLKLTSGDDTVYRYDNEDYYYTDGGEIALRLSDPKVAVSPGMSGEISFYIIPSRDGPQTVTLHLGLAGYKETKAENGSTGSKINDPVLSSLISGHILLFEDNTYSKWLPGSVSTGGSNYQITASKPDAKTGKPWQVKLYWVWPLRYENMKDDFNGLLNAFIDKQTKLTQIRETGYYYSQIFLSKSQNLEHADTEARSDAYNQADEYIGRNANYLYVTIQTDVVN